MTTRSTIVGRALVLGGALFAASVAGGQEPERRPRREVLERRVEQAVARQLRERVGLTDQQMQQLRAVNQRFEPQRRALFERERGVRQELRAQLRPGATADQPRVARLLDSLLTLQRERLDLVAAEQREFAGFMTPVQRARLHAMQEQLRRRVDEMRGRRGGPPGRGRPPG